MYGTVVATFAERYLARKPLEVRSPGTQTRAFTHVADTIDGIVLVGEKGEGDGYGLSAHDMYSLLDLAHLFGNDIVMLPQTQTTRETSVVDSSKIEALGWKQKHRLKEYVADVKKKMKRVLIFSLAYYPSFVSGAEAAIKEITDRIDPSDIEFHMLTLLFDRTAPREETIGNVHVHRVGFGGAYLSKIFYTPLAAMKARSLDAQLHFSGIWSMMTYMLLPAVLAGFIGVRAPRVLTLQDGDPYEKVFERWFIRPLTPLLDYGFRTTSVIQVISSYLGTYGTPRLSRENRTHPQWRQSARSKRICVGRGSYGTQTETREERR